MEESITKKLLTILYKIGEMVTWLSIISLFLFPFFARHYSIFFKDLGGTLPLMTKLVLNWWFPYIFALLALIMMFLRRFPRRVVNIKAERIIIIISFLISLTGLGLCIISLLTVV